MLYDFLKLQDGKRSRKVKAIFKANFLVRKRSWISAIIFQIICPIVDLLRLEVFFLGVYESSYNNYQDKYLTMLIINGGMHQLNIRDYPWIKHFFYAPKNRVTKEIIKSVQGCMYVERGKLQENSVATRHNQLSYFLTLNMYQFEKTICILKKWFLCF